MVVWLKVSWHKNVRAGERESEKCTLAIVPSVSQNRWNRHSREFDTLNPIPDFRSSSFDCLPVAPQTYSTSRKGIWKEVMTRNPN